MTARGSTKATLWRPLATTDPKHVKRRVLGTWVCFFFDIILLLTTLLGTSRLTTTTDADSETTTASQAQTKGPKHKRRVVMTNGGRCWRTLGGEKEWCPRHVVWRVLGLFSMLFFIFHLFFHYWPWLLGSNDERRAWRHIVWRVLGLFSMLIIFFSICFFITNNFI
jgi:hypothetical protein